MSDVVMQSEKDVQQCTEKLLEAIHNSKVFSDYVFARDEIQRYPERKERADRFRRDNYLSRNGSGEETAGMQAELYQQRQQLRLDPVIDNYLNAELVLCRMLRECAVRILNAADLDLENMEDIL